MILVAAMAVFLAIGSQELRDQRSDKYRWEAKRHARKEEYWRRQSRYAFLTSNEKALNAQRAEYHARMRQKYLQAASDPWTRVEEEPEP
jgi:hypothetical protein